MSHKLKITLEGSEPKIYRTVIAPEKFTFHELHCVIQNVMNCYISSIQEELIQVILLS